MPCCATGCARSRFEKTLKKNPPQHPHRDQIHKGSASLAFVNAILFKPA
jgi:hypothetical protein